MGATGFAVALAAASVGGWPTGEAEVPRGWVLADIERAAAPGGGSFVYILAWSIMEDDRPLRVEQCLVLKNWPTADGRSGWTLSTVYRHPRDRDAEWTLPPLWVSPPPPLGPAVAVSRSTVKRFAARPTAVTLTAALAEIEWSFTVEPGWRLLAAAVCERNWLAAVGSAPTHSFRTR